MTRKRNTSPEPTPPRVTHDDLMISLAEHLRGNSDRMVWCDMQLGPMWSARPDVWTLNKSYTNPKPMAYECKISVADFRSDVTSGKWQSYLGHSCAVTFAVPAGLVTKDDLPKGCGLMTWNGTEWRTAKAATLNHQTELPQDLMLKLLIDGVKRCEEATRIRLRGQWQAEKAVREKFGLKVAEVVRDELNLDQRIAFMRQSYDQERKREEEESRRRREERQREADTAWVELRKVLSLPESAAGWHVGRAIQDLAAAVSRDREVVNLTARIREITDAVERAKNTPNQELLKNLPGPPAS